MQWIADNAEHITAIVGALYVLARVIVHMTPTPKDDEALKKVGTPLRALAKAFGLDLKQGVESKKPDA